MEVGERVRVKHGDFTEEVGESRCQGEAARGTKEGEISCRSYMRSKPVRCVLRCRGGMCLHWTKFGS